MKRTSQDFADKLAGKQDKVAAVKCIKEVLVDLGYSCKVARRQTATGRKIYFTIEPVSEDRAYPTPWWKESSEIIETHFPKSHLTSGGSLGWTIAEY